MIKTLQVVCPTCHAAVGAQCTKPVRDGSQFTSEFHHARLKEVGAFHEFVPDAKEPKHCAKCWQYEAWWQHQEKHYVGKFVASPHGDTGTKV